MEKQKGKIRTWYEEHKEGIKSKAVKLICIAGGLTVGSIVATKITTNKITLGTYQLHKDGMIKFFDPSTGQEIEANKLSEVAKKIYEI